MFKKLYQFIRRFTLPIIVFLFLVYCFSDKGLWTDFNGYVASFRVPIRQGVLAVMLFFIHNVYSAPDSRRFHAAPVQPFAF